MLSSLRFERTALGAIAACTVALAGCTGGNGSGFVSDDPSASRARGEFAADGDGASSSGAGGGEPTPNATAGDDAERAIAEADIVQVDGDRLYALSQYGGLSIIAIQNPDKPKLLGRYRASGIPFEMYLRDGRVYAMFSSWGQSIYESDTDTWRWVTSSRIEALDVADPAHVLKLGSFDLPGDISDSRVVGDVLYAVTYQDGYCWGCNESPNTTITSLAIGDPAAIGVVDQLTYTSTDPYGYGWWRRSIAVTDERMYVAGVEWDGEGDEGHSTIQIVDISDPAGHLVKGASVEAKGQVESRWQMDEKDGVLRVISQPGIWFNGSVPAVQTFTVTSSTEVAPLGYLDLALPRPETLRSVRFDGSRAYAITAEQTDPLFTIDLTDPAHPVQAAELEMPGWIYHMQPRGDRLYALGYDNTNAGGSLNVSLFDVADLAHPTLLARVHFGGQWTTVPEDQDRIHKAFKFDDDLGTIFVPYSAWSYGDDEYGCGSYESGVQLVDFTHDGLQKRGVAPARGWARRALVTHGRLFTVSDAEVRAYDVSNRDAPVSTGALALSNNVSQSVPVGNKVARLGTDWWTGEARLEIVDASDPARPEPLGSIDLAELNQDPGQWCWGWGYYGARVFAHGDTLYLTRTVYDYGSDWNASQSFDVATIDISDPAAPKVKGRLTFPIQDSYGWLDGIVASGDTVAQVGTTLAVLGVSRSSWDQGSTEHATVAVVDLSDPAHPTLTASVALPDGLGHTPLVADGSAVALSHWESAGDAGQIRFFYDRIDLTVPAVPIVLPAINVPGSLVAIDPATGHLLTVDYTSATRTGVSHEECYQAFGWTAEFAPTDPTGDVGLCTGLERSFKLVDAFAEDATVLDEVPAGMYFDSVKIGDDRVFAMSGGYWGYGYAYDEVGDGDGYGYGGGSPSYRLLAVGGMNEGSLQLATHALDAGDSAYPVAAAGKRLVLAGYDPPSISVLDATDLDSLAYGRVAEVDGYVSSVSVMGDVALCSMEQFGLQAVSLGD